MDDTKDEPAWKALAAGLGWVAITYVLEQWGAYLVPSSLKPMPQLPGHSPDYDRILQEQLQRDMGGMNLGPAIHSHQQQPLVPRGTQPISAPQQRSPPRMAAMKLPEIPPFRGAQSALPPQPPPKLANQQAGTPLPQARQPQPPRGGAASNQNIHPSTSKEAARPPSTPTSHSSTPEPPQPAAFGTPLSFPSPAPNPNGDLDALNDVIFPALEEALKRRQARLQTLYGQPSQRAGQPGGGAPTQRQQRAEAAHERIRKSVFKLAQMCKEIDVCDKAEPVGMGKDVGTFLEGLLEEILVRVEPLDEEEA